MRMFNLRECTKFYLLKIMPEFPIFERYLEGRPSVT